MTQILKGGAQTEDARLDRVYELDWRSLNYLSGPSTEVTAQAPRSYTWPLAVVLDQGSEGSCVGHGYAHEALASPVPVTGIDHEYARQQIYWNAQREDPWPGGAYPGASPQYEGTSVLTGAKVMQDYGYYSAYRWGIKAIDVAEYIGHGGPAVLGVNWYDQMYDPDDNGFLHADGNIVGGHCILAIGVKIVWKHWYNKLVSRTWDNVDLDKSYVVLHNSWGPGWATNGRAKLTLTDLDKLMAAQGEACFPVRTSLRTAVIK